MEIWKDIPGYEGEYEASSYGRIRTKEGKTTHSVRCGVRRWKQRILKQKWQARHSGCHKDARITLWHEKQPRTVLVARCVCAAFYPCEDFERKTVNHKDGNSENNRADNLEWLSNAENIKHGFENGLYHSQKSVRLTDESGGYLDFRSLSAASRYLGRNDNYISRKMARGQYFAKAFDGEFFTITMD